jgi:hypothetical protein
MSGKAQKPPAGEPWVWQTRELLRSDAWRSLSINGRRFIDFLLIEHMSKGGRHNGKLMAPRRQLARFGISTHCLSSAITEAERLGLVDCRHGKGRRPSVFVLTWLPMMDGSLPSNRWRTFHNPALSPIGNNGCTSALNSSAVMSAQSAQQ